MTKPLDPVISQDAGRKHLEAPSPDIILVPDHEACRMLGIRPTTLFHLRKLGVIKSVVIKSHRGNLKGRRLFSVESIKAYAQKLLKEAEEQEHHDVVTV